MQRWLSWSKAHDWKSCVRLITDREFESLPLREQERESLWFSFFLQRKSESNFLFLRLLYSSKKLHGNEDSLYPKWEWRRKTGVFQIDCIDCGRRLLLRVWAPHLHSKCQSLRSRLLVNLRSRWSMADMVSFCLRTLIPISRAVTRNQ